MRPTVLGSGRRYRASELLSEDPLGSLWTGADAWTGTAVTVRVLHERLTTDPHRLHQVGERLRRLQWAAASPHLGRVVDQDLRRIGGRPAFAVFEASGEPLSLRIEREGAWPIDRAAAAARAVAEGLGAAHAARVVHGALTAGSVLVRDDGLVAVIDIGLGELLADRDERRRSPPRGDPADRAAADVFSVTVLLDRLVSGPDVPALVEGEPPRPWVSTLPVEVSGVLARASSPHRRLRPDATELAAALRLVPDTSPPAGGLVPPLLPPGPEALPEPPAGAVAAARVAVPAARSTPPEAVPPAAADTLPPAPEAAPGRRGVAVALMAAAAAVAIVAASVFVLLGGLGGEGTPAPSGSGAATPSILVPVAVPAILGLSEDQARTLLEGAGLVVGSVTAVPGAEGIVTDSDPTQGEAVTTGTTVDLSVGDGTTG